MPLLKTASINNPGSFCGVNVNNTRCGSCADRRRQCQLFCAISNAKHLELMSSTPMFVSKKDLNLWPTFSKLKILLLNDNWCITCILEHSPVLKKLTLLLFTEGRKHNLEMSGCYGSTGTSSAMSKHLQIVEVKCRVVDEGVLEVLR